MEKSIKILNLVLIVLILFNVISVSAISVSSQGQLSLLPGEEGTLTIIVDNTLEDDIEEVSLSLDFKGIPFTSIGSSENTADEIRQDRDENFVFKIKSSSNAIPGDYNIPYSLIYKNSSKAKTGTIGISVKGNVELSYSISSEKPVIGEEDKINIKLINKGFGDAKFVSINLQPNGYTLLSEQIVYIGDISANDFETASFDVLYNSDYPLIEAIIEYKDFENKNNNIVIKKPLKIYNLEEAQKLGIIKKSNTGKFLSIIILLILIWIVYRSIKKRMRKKSMLNK